MTRNHLPFSLIADRPSTMGEMCLQLRSDSVFVEGGGTGNQLSIWVVVIEATVTSPVLSDRGDSEAQAGHIPEYGDVAGNQTGAHTPWRDTGSLSILSFLPAPLLHSSLRPPLIRCSSVWGTCCPPAPIYLAKTFSSFKLNLLPHFLPEALPDQPPCQPSNCTGTSPGLTHFTLSCSCIHVLPPLHRELL